MTSSDHYDAIVLGAGAAGLMCAAIAGQRGQRVLILDHGPNPGRKILISGGGRCNFTNIQCAPDRFISANPHFAKSALSRYSAQDFLDLVESYHIAWHEKTLGQLFCDESARQIVDMLLEECAKGAVEIECNVTLGDTTHSDGHYSCTLADRTVRAPTCVVATGGPSIPKIGGSTFAYELARKFGLKIVQPRPALVPLTLGADEALFRELSGVSADVVTISGKTRFREAALFTHRGLSGPAILQISSYWQNGENIAVNFLPDHPTGFLSDAKREKPQQSIGRVLSGELPDRLSTALLTKLGLDGEIGSLTDKRLNAAEERLKSWTFTPSGSEGFAKAEVTVGGVSTKELSSKTMEARSMPGLYVIGEAVDVTGWLGGYNFQWAWASAVAAGEAIALKAAA
ncbi:NAD(P)/FAD-dependent oxidoreductase [Altericroceibacterium endophyticum]|uniref:Aminoacetone oxidase family FAD-binding enzyme n=1 Tax=Altericroceibacterium endophyticum TaxID=1808508 RepID=A0A6I4T235_9SPHN|nr:NAD(P)/FAD-dependent oxidoreductase [Altericroceibacterium endophyticum]MXO64402.1 aminoacetone oxidase family FAD-binding enzyme [Altericroceibacterium endophyticum]